MTSGAGARRRRAQASSCSTLTRPAVSFTPTAWPSISTVRVDPRLGPAIDPVARMPRLPVSASSTAATRSTDAPDRTAPTRVWAGRPFFITIGVTHAS